MPPGPEAFQQIIPDLERLRAARADVFGADVHEFRVRRPVAEAEVARFEEKHGISLPADYRMFLLTVGRGGAGPAYGLFDLGEVDDGFGFQKWKEGDWIIGKLAVPFSYTAAWNDLTGEPADSLMDTDEEEYTRQLEAFEERYLAALDGAIPICHLGCALRQWLVVTGPEAGNVWGDDRADREGLYPLATKAGERVSFYRWYRDWLDEAVGKVKTSDELG